MGTIFDHIRKKALRKYEPLMGKQVEVIWESSLNGKVKARGYLSEVETKVTGPYSVTYLLIRGIGKLREGIVLSCKEVS